MNESNGLTGTIVLTRVKLYLKLMFTYMYYNALIVEYISLAIFYPFPQLLIYVSFSASLTRA